MGTYAWNLIIKRKFQQNPERLYPWLTLPSSVPEFPAFLPPEYSVKSTG